MAKTQLATHQLKDQAVTTGKIASQAVETAKIKDASVTAVKVAPNTISTAKMVNGAITNAKVNNAAAISETKIALTRATNSLVQGNVNLLRIVSGNATILAGAVSIFVVFPGAFTFSGVVYQVVTERQTPVPVGLYITDISDTWVQDKAVTGFRLYLARPNTINVVYDYIALGV